MYILYIINIVDYFVALKPYMNFFFENSKLLKEFFGLSILADAFSSLYISFQNTMIKEYSNNVIL